jgi:AhpC/TSA family
VRQTVIPTRADHVDMPRDAVPILRTLTWGFLLCCLSSAQEQVLDLAGKSVDAFKASSGKLVVLVFIRTDCPISNRYAPTIQGLSAQYEGQAAFWLVYPDKTESTTAIQKHLREYGYKLQALRDRQHTLVKRSQVQITPEAAVFDSHGQLAYHGRIDNWYQSFGRARSAPTTHELEDAIQAALNGSHPQVAATTGVGCYISDLE